MKHGIESVKIRVDPWLLPERGDGFWELFTAQPAARTATSPLQRTFLFHQIFKEQTRGL